jgi:hypothetical protein
MHDGYFLSSTIIGRARSRARSIISVAAKWQPAVIRTVQLQVICPQDCAVSSMIYRVLPS